MQRDQPVSDPVQRQRDGYDHGRDEERRRTRRPPTIRSRSTAITSTSVAPTAAVVEGVDVPRAFDGAVTASIPANGSATFRSNWSAISTKSESPLVQLVNNSNVLATIAIITFYGTDAVGNVVSAAGQMTVNFGNFGDQ